MIEDDINYSIKISCFPWLLLFITRCEWNRDCLIVRLNGVVNSDLLPEALPCHHLDLDQRLYFFT